MNDKFKILGARIAKLWTVEYVRDCSIYLECKYGSGEMYDEDIQRLIKLCDECDISQVFVNGKLYVNLKKDVDFHMIHLSCETGIGISSYNNAKISNVIISTRTESEDKYDNTLELEGIECGENVFIKWGEVDTEANGIEDLLTPNKNRPEDKRKNVLGDYIRIAVGMSQEVIKKWEHWNTRQALGYSSEGMSQEIYKEWEASCKEWKTMMGHMPVDA